MNDKPRLLLGFDRVLHQYRAGWQDGSVYDDPVPGAQTACEELMRRYNVVIFTARVNSFSQQSAVGQWLRQYHFPDMDITNVKLPAQLIVDQRALRFQQPAWEAGIVNEIDRLCQQ